jgi:hypothetical protein
MAAGTLACAVLSTSMIIVFPAVTKRRPIADGSRANAKEAAAWSKASG